MAEWNAPVFDRTEADVNTAKRQIAEWIAMDIPSDTIVTYGLKGCLNVQDLNRIEGNIQYLTDLLSAYQYKVGAYSKEWTMQNLPTQSDINRILNNVSLFLQNYATPVDAPEVPQSMKYWYEINDIEKILLLLKETIEYMELTFQKSNMFKSGAMRFLPIQR